MKPYSNRGEIRSIPENVNVSCSAPLLDVRCLNVIYDDGPRVHIAVSSASLHMVAGETVGIFGPSGSGKTSFALALPNLLPPIARRTADALRFCGRDLLHANEKAMRKVHGKEISIMHQESVLALNPVIRVGDQVAEVIRAHEPMHRQERHARVWELLRCVGLDDRKGIFNAYPHELSGGERHRIVIAQAIACQPFLIIADEPTAGLDAELKPEVLDLIARLREELRLSFLLISHDRKMLAQVADRTFEMVAGHLEERSIQEQTDTASFTREATSPISRHTNATDDPVVTVSGLCKAYAKRGLSFGSSRQTEVLRDVSFSIQRGSTLALVGPSGSGKSTLARCLALWDRPDAGQIIFDRRDLTRLSASEIRLVRPRIQLVLQDSAAALNPNLTALEIVEEPLLILGRGSKRERESEVVCLLAELGLDRKIITQKALEISGGQRQRLAVARALIVNPELVIFDESTTGLDIEAQKQMFELLTRLRRSRNFTYLLISHDPDLVRQVADYIAFMQAGSIVKTVPASESLQAPSEPSWQNPTEADSERSAIAVTER